MRRCDRLRRGFALLATLWIIVGIAVLAAAGSAAARGGLATARNRASIRRAAWRAEDCLERSRASIAAALDSSDGWRWRDLREASTVVRSDCRATIVAGGALLDVNDADADRLRRLLQAQGIAPAAADSLVDALLDWRDTDDVPRSFGAERAWYAAHLRAPPRNGPFGHAEELRLVRGFESRADLTAFLSVESGRTPLDLAPLPVIASLPGFTSETVARVAEMRLRGERVTDVLALGARLSPASRDSIVAHYAELQPLSTTEPDAWLLTATGWSGTPAVKATVDVRLARAGTRAAIVRRRASP